MVFLKEDSPRNQVSAKGGFRRAWRESHGSALLGFAATILLIGLLLIWLSPPGEQSADVELSPEMTDSPPNIELPEDALIIRVATDRRSSEGPIRIAIYDSKEAFGDPEQAILKDSLVPVDGFVVWEIKLKILPERFAVAAYHDLDNNGQLNRALFNAPVEPYGFSNNVRSLVGPPTYEQTLIDGPSGGTAIEIRVY